MSLTVYPDRVAKASVDPGTTPDQLDFLEERLRDTMSLSLAQAHRSYAVLMSISVVWLLVRSSVVQKVSLMGIEFGRTPVLLLFLPVIAAFFYYRYACLDAIAEIAEAGLRRHYAQHLPVFSKEGVTELFIPSTFLNAENALANLESSHSFFSIVTNAWGITSYLVMNLGPAVFLSWCAWTMARNPVVAAVWCWVIATSVWIVAVRTLLVFIQRLRML